MLPSCRLLVPVLLLMTVAAFAAETADRQGFAKGPDTVSVVGSNQVIYTAEGDTLIQLARANGLGFQSLAAANPGIDPWLPGAGKPLLLPYSAIIPGPALPGITVNLAELRLYLIRNEAEAVRVRIYPIGIGDEGWETPEGTFAIKEKVERPNWTPPPSIRRARPELPRMIPPGPDNPLGDYWLGFTAAGHGIHGTRQPYGVGRRVSHGCLRLYPEDIRDLYGRTEVGTPVRVIYRPLKAAEQDGILFVEAHRDYRRDSRELRNSRLEVEIEIRRAGWKGPIDWPVVEQVVAEARGIPIPVSGQKRSASLNTGKE